MTRMRRLARPAVLVSYLILTAGCASAPKPAGDARVTPPRLLSSPRPELRFSPRMAARPIDIRVEVEIDPNGRPNIETLRVTGVGAPDNRDIIATWIQSSQFEPAHRDGRPVTGTYRTRFRVNVRRTS